MISRVRTTSEDRQLLGRCAQPPAAAAPQDWRGKLVTKPWGHEFVCFSGAAAAGWVLCIEPGWGTSFHCHTGKQTALLLLSGAATCRTSAGVHRLTPTGALLVEPGAFHSVQATGAAPAWLLEVEAPNAKEDLVRFSDPAGRQGQGYAPQAAIEASTERTFLLGPGDAAPADAPVALRAVALEDRAALRVPASTRAVVVAGALLDHQGGHHGPGSAVAEGRFHAGGPTTVLLAGLPP